jgi:uroporphyrinogen-III synthase
MSKRIVITRPISQAQAVADLIKQSGDEPILFPTIQIEPLDDNDALDAALRRLHVYDWVIFTSANGVQLVVNRMRQIGVPPVMLNQCKVAVIGPATAAALEIYGIKIDLQPSEYIAESIYEAIAAQAQVEGKRFLLLRAETARPTLREMLHENGAAVSELPVYRTVRGTPDSVAYDELRRGVDVITFTSSSTVHNFFDLLGTEAKSIADKATIACIGPVTAQTAESLGLKVTLVADEYTVPGLLRAVAS